MGLVVLLLVVSRIIGLLIAGCIYKFGNTEVYDKSAKKAFGTDGNGTGAYVFFSAVLFSVLTFWINMWPMIPKARVMLDIKDIRPNMYIFKQNDPSGKHSPAVILADEGY